MPEGTCEHCARHFDYALYHCGFGNCAYAYCDTCGRTALLDEYYARIPAAVSFRSQGPLDAAACALLAPCGCGGRFTHQATPRCPLCLAELSANSAASYIEAGAPGTAKGWKWQRSWTGIYCIDIGCRALRDNWRLA